LLMCRQGTALAAHLPAQAGDAYIITHN
jgi:hypothetical protein